MTNASGALLLALAAGAIISLALAYLIDTEKANQRARQRRMTAYEDLAKKLQRETQNENPRTKTPE